MVAISLYRGNLHRVPDVPRRWLMPIPRISLKDFRILLRKREKALSRISSTTAPTSSNPNPNPDFKQEEGVGDSGCSKQNGRKLCLASEPQSQPTIARNSEDAPSQHGTVEHAKDQNEADCDPRAEQSRELGGSISSYATNAVVPESVCAPKDGGGGSVSGRIPKDLQEEKPVDSVQPFMEVSKNVDVMSDKEKRKAELEEKLQVLNEKKHNLVQMLKQILNVEEEMKKRNSIQASMLRPSAPLQVDGTIDLGSITRNAVPRISSEGNFSGDLEGEAEDISNPNTHGRHLQRMRSTSPSSASPLRRPTYSSSQHNAIPHTSRGSFGTAGHAQTTTATPMGVTASPSRFAPTGHPGHPANLPPVSVYGTHYSASSPSPAASGGTSVFRDSRLTSPSWS